MLQDVYLSSMSDVDGCSSATVQVWWAAAVPGGHHGDLPPFDVLSCRFRSPGESPECVGQHAAPAFKHLRGPGYRSFIAA